MGTFHLSEHDAWPMVPEERIAADLVERLPAVVAPTTRVQDAERLAMLTGVHHLVVVGPAREPLGVLCTCDLDGCDPALEVSQCMSTPADTVDGAVSVGELVDLVRHRHRGCVPLTEEGRVRGIVTRGDLRRAGVLSEEDCPRCAICGSFHHVRVDGPSGAQLCLQCRRDTVAWDAEDDPDFIEYGGGD